MKRAFVALDLPEAPKARLLAALGTLPSGARPVAPEQLHLTLRFLGNVADAAFVALRERLGEIVAPPFTLTLEGPGTFPPERDAAPSVLWMGLRPSDALTALRARIDDAAFSAGTTRDDRAFTAHVTLARLRDVPRAAIVPALDALAGLGAIEVPVTAFTLYTSVLSNVGAEHTRARTYDLRNPADGVG